MDKIELNTYTVYLKQCPSCGAQRSIGEKAGKCAIVAGGGMVTAGLFGAPVIGLLGFLGIMKLAIAGAIAAPVAVKACEANIEILKWMNKGSFFKCPRCGCSEILRKR
jgi:hypothetical protein